MAETITVDMIIHDVVTKHPETVKVFHSRESIAGGARTHRFTPEKQALLLKDLNAVVKGEPISVAPKKAPVGRGIPLTMAPAGKDGTIKQVIAIMSGKGGVGKSLVTGLLAVSLRRQGLRVGILDGDITGPSIARMFGTKGQPAKSASGGIEPLTSMGGIRVMSMNMFLENESSPVVWRGPMVSSAIKQFFDGIVIVSSPQLLATMVVKKCINMVLQLKGIIVGVVENMAYFETPDGERYEIFGPSNGPELVDMTDAPLLAQLPIDSILTTLCDAGRIEEYHGEAYDTLAANFVNTLKIKR